MNSYFRWYRMDTDLCVEYAEMRLGGQAKIFWENEYLAAERRGLPITTWAEMVQKLRNKYVSRQYEATLFLSWLDLQQGKSPVRDYIQTFEECRMRCRFVEDPRIVIGLFTHVLTTRLRNEVLKSCPSKVDEAYRIVEHMERPGDDAPVTTTTQTARALFTRSTTTTTPSQPRPGGGNSRTTPTTSVGSAPPSRVVTTDSSLRTTVVAPPPITFKCQGKGHRASQCPSSNLLIGLEDDTPDYTVDDDVLGDDIYVADDGLEEECLDPDVIGYIKITSAASSHSPTAPHGSTVVSIAVPSPSSGTPVSRPPRTRSPGHDPRLRGPVPHPQRHQGPPPRLLTRRGFPHRPLIQ